MRRYRGRVDGNSTAILRLLSAFSWVMGSTKERYKEERFLQDACRFVLTDIPCQGVYVFHKHDEQCKSDACAGSGFTGW